MKKAEAYEEHKRLHSDRTISYNSFCNRIYRGMAVEEAINKPGKGHGGERRFPEGKSYDWFRTHLNEYLYE